MPWILPLLLGCHPPELRVVQVTELGALEQSQYISGRDGGYSARLFGQSVWAYGDTMLTVEADDGSTWRSSTVSWTADTDASDGLTGFEDKADGRGVPAEFLPATQAEAAFNDAHEGDDCSEEPCGARWTLWPGAMAWDPEGERALVFYNKAYSETEQWNFEGVGSGIATWTGLDAEPERPELDPSQRHPTLLFHQGEPAFGAAALVADGVLYAWACAGEGDQQCVVGRVVSAEALDRSAWSYWDGEGWAGSLDAAAPLFDAHSILSVHHSSWLDRYIAAYNRPFDDRIYLRTAPAPQGPWSADEAVYMADPSWDGEVAYGGLAHAEFAGDDGHHLLLSYFRSPAPLEGELQLVELELERR